MFFSNLATFWLLTASNERVTFITVKRKHLLLALCLLLIVSLSLPVKGQGEATVMLPDSVRVVSGLPSHVQGIAVDAARGSMYFSFTTQFIRTDMEGRVLGTIDRIPGHLGAMALNADDGKVYVSLECKDDEIGAGIARQLGLERMERTDCAFYIAVIDPMKVTRQGMTPDEDEAMQTILLPHVVNDYLDTVSTVHGPREHRYGCSGIDGVAIAPKVGHKGGKNQLYVAYGIYGDPSRTDNNYQVIHCYDISRWNYHTRSATPRKTYFVHTGNTSYGVQNMTYDPATRQLLMAVYKGSKPNYPNYDLYAADLSRHPFHAALEGVPYAGNGLQLRLSRQGLHDDATGVSGWRFPYGSTGIQALGDGYFYLSQNFKDKASGHQGTDVCLYRWTDDPAKPFERIRKMNEK